MTSPEFKTADLPPEQRQLWAQLGGIPSGFVLYGGTAIALQLGHRKSEDFDFFTSQPFSPPVFLPSLTIFKDAEIRMQKDNTLNLSIPVGDTFVNMSFFGGLTLKRIQEPLLADNGVYVASLPDLLGMKCKVVIDRAESKDYLDIVAILRQTDLTLTDGLALATAIYGKNFIPLSSLKALAYTADLPEALSAYDQAFLYEAVKTVDIVNLPIIEPQGEIGQHASDTAPSNSNLRKTG